MHELGYSDASPGGCGDPLVNTVLPPSDQRRNRRATAAAVIPTRKPALLPAQVQPGETLALTIAEIPTQVSAAVMRPNPVCASGSDQRRSGTANRSTARNTNNASATSVVTTAGLTGPGSGTV